MFSKVEIKNLTLNLEISETFILMKYTGYARNFLPLKKHFRIVQKHFPLSLSFESLFESFSQYFSLEPSVASRTFSWIWKNAWSGCWLYALIMSRTRFRVNPHLICSCMNVNELLARSRREIWSLNDYKWTRIHNHLVYKRTLNHSALDHLALGHLVLGYLVFDIWIKKFAQQNLINMKKRQVQHLECYFQ